MNPVFRPRDEQGAVLVHAAVMLVALTAFSALVFDLGVMFVSRGQAQNAADAGALAAATSLAYVSNGSALARTSAIAAARQNLVWGEAPGISGTDVQPGIACPAGASAGGTCVRVNVFRTSYQGGGGNPLPTFFANIVGLTEQGTRASAMAQAAARPGTADCVKPWAMPDKWLAWTPLATFTPADTYIPPRVGVSGTGFTLPADFGRQLQLTFTAAGTAASATSLFAVRIAPLAPTLYVDAITGCSAENITPGTALATDASASAGLTVTGASDLISRDAGAAWNPAASAGRGAPSGGCMASGACTRSPRLVAVVLFDPALYESGRLTNPIYNVTKVVGFWIESIAGAGVVGYLTPYPTVSLTGPVFNLDSSFARTVVLIR